MNSKTYFNTWCSCPDARRTHDCQRDSIMLYYMPLRALRRVHISSREAMNCRRIDRLVSLDIGMTGKTRALL